MISRVTFDLQGELYTLPINPVDFEILESSDYSNSSTLDGASVRYEQFFDDRMRRLIFRNIPNKGNFISMRAKMLSSIGVSGVKINYKGLSIYEESDIWRDIVIENVRTEILSNADSGAVGKLKFDMEVQYSYLKYLTYPFYPILRPEPPAGGTLGYKTRGGKVRGGKPSSSYKKGAISGVAAGGNVSSTKHGKIEGLYPTMEAYFITQPLDFYYPIYIEKYQRPRLDMLVAPNSMGPAQCNGIRSVVEDRTLFMYGTNQYFPLLRHRNPIQFELIMMNAYAAVSGYFLRIIGYTAPPPSYPPRVFPDGIIPCMENATWAATRDEVVMNKEIADVTIDLYKKNIEGYYSYNNYFTGYDGAYIDMCNDSIQGTTGGKDKQIQNFIASGYHVDSDGDNVGESIEEMRLQYKIYRMYLLSGLRVALGPNKRIMVNSAGPCKNPKINDISIEARYTSYANILAAFDEHRAIAEYDSKYVFWMPTTTLTPHVHYGFIWSGDPTTTSGLIQNYVRNHEDTRYGCRNEWIVNGDEWAWPDE